MTNTFVSEFLYAARQGPRLFFAPLVGAINEVRSEMRRIEDENARWRNIEKTAMQTARTVDQRGGHQ